MAKHSWTKQELKIVSVCYLEHLPIDVALLLTETTDTTSMQMRYRNCLYLDKGKVENSLSHPSKKHVEAWEEVKAVYPKKEEFISESVETFVSCFAGLGVAICVLVAVYALSLL